MRDEICGQPLAHPLADQTVRGIRGNAKEGHYRPNSRTEKEGDGAQLPKLAVSMTLEHSSSSSSSSSFSFTHLGSTLYLPSRRAAGLGIVWRSGEDRRGLLSLSLPPIFSLPSLLPPPSPFSPSADSLLFSKEQLKRLLHSRMIDDRGFQVALDARSVKRQAAGVELLRCSDNFDFGAYHQLFRNNSLKPKTYCSRPMELFALGAHNYLRISKS